MDGSGLGRLSAWEVCGLYATTITAVKVLPFFSISIWKVGVGFMV